MSDKHHNHAWHKARARTYGIRDGGVCLNPFGVHNNDDAIGGQVITPATDAHHIIPVDTAPELITNPDNIVSLCDTCHKLAHHLLNTDIAAYKRAFAKQLALLPAARLDSYVQNKRDKPPFEIIPKAQCYQLPSGEWFCQRRNKAVITRCGCCPSRK